MMCVQAHTHILYTNVETLAHTYKQRGKEREENRGKEKAFKRKGGTAEKGGEMGGNKGGATLRVRSVRVQLSVVCF